MSVIPCEKDERLKALIEEYSETLKETAHTLGDHGLTEAEFYQSGLFRGAVERIRGQFSATMREKRQFVRHVLEHMVGGGFIRDWDSSGESNRHDYTVTLNSGRVSVIELKGCLDGNNTTIFERPDSAQEFIIWSVCTNQAADPRHNVWSGIHTRLSAEVIEEKKHVDGLIVWDWICGTAGRPCPKVAADATRVTVVGPHKLTPPCLYLFPRTVPSVRTNPDPAPHALDDVGFLRALYDCFGGTPEELNFVRFQVANLGPDVTRITKIVRGGAEVEVSDPTVIRRG